MIWNWKTGGGLAGLLAGATVAGPVGAIMGGLAGLLVGSQVQHTKDQAAKTKSEDK